MPEITVVIPTRNRCELLKQTLSYATRQQSIDFEIIVIDDGSSDSTTTLVYEFGDRAVKLLRHDTAQGVSAARNRGIIAARGEWVAFLDDDDLWAPTKLRRQIDVALDLNRNWAYGGSVAVDSTLQVIGGKPPPSAKEAVEQLPYRNIVPAGASNVLVRKDLLRAVGSFDTDLRHMADWDLWIRLAQHGAPAVVPEPVVAYRIHAGNASTDIGQIPAEIGVIERKFADRRTKSRVDRAYVYRWIAWSCLRMGQRRKAVRAYLRAAATGDLLSLGRAAIGVIDPAIARRRSSRHGSDPGWAAQAEKWLHP